MTPVSLYTSRVFQKPGYGQQLGLIQRAAYGQPFQRWPDVSGISKGDAALSEQALSASSGGFLFDAIYNPGETELMRLARKNGICALGGMSMLVWQAAAAQEIWYGAHFSQQAISGIVTDMEQLIRAEF